MWRVRMFLQLPQRQTLHNVATALMTRQMSTVAGDGASNNGNNENNNAGDGKGTAVPATSIAPGPYRCVGNVFIVHCDDHPFKHSWEVNRILRELRLEFKGQTTIVPDIPQVRKRLWRVRNVVQVDMLDLDEAKALIGVPEHITFNDLASQLPASFGRVRGVANPTLRSKMNFMKLRRMRLRDVLHRDALELRLLEEKRKALAKSQNGSVQEQGEGA